MLSRVTVCLLRGLISVCMCSVYVWCVCVCTHVCRVTPVEEVRGQLCGVGILSSPLCGFWEPNSGHQVCTASIFYLLSHPLAPTGALSFVFLRQDAMSSGWPQTPCEARTGFERLPDLTVSTF